MIDPYRMIIVNVIASGILISALLFNRYIYPKKNIPFPLVIFLLSLLPLISLLRKGSYESGDLSLHATRAISYYNILIKEHVIPSWSPDLNLGYGDAYFEYIYALPYMLISLIHFIGFSFINSVKILIALSYITSGITFYYFAKKHFNNLSSIAGSILYLFVPYHLVDMHFRVSIAETLSFAIVPLLFLFTNKITKNQSLRSSFFLSLAIAALMLSHQVIFLITVPFLTLYFLILLAQIKNNKKNLLFYYFLAIFIGLGYTIFYWLPILLESKYIYQSALKGKIDFVPFRMLIYSPWRFGMLYQGHKGELSFLIGYSQLAVVVISLILLFKNKIKKESKILFLYFITSFFLLIFMTQAISKPFWSMIPLINNFQFSYRLLLFISFFTSCIMCIVASNLRRKYLIILIVSFAVFSTILNWGNRKSIPQINDHFLSNNLSNGPTITGNAEPTAPKWINFKIDGYYPRRITNADVLSGKTKILDLYGTPYHKISIIQADTNSKIKVNTFYYPGWTLKLNNYTYNFKYSDKKYPGIITFDVKKGLYKVELIYTKTPVRKISAEVSLFFIFITGALGIYYFAKKTNYF